MHIGKQIKGYHLTFHILLFISLFTGANLLSKSQFLKFFYFSCGTLFFFNFILGSYVIMILYVFIFFIFLELYLCYQGSKMSNNILMKRIQLATIQCEKRNNFHVYEFILKR